ncbi:hypothetical protein [Devosia sp. RR2S18]|uniref:hypothetical protein n=1 Tax=Devosia rhizosphaerae TaxID=3049774 RepID=UPI0025400AB4|nr:hypothetical protein [Devosia sp. RR2S18]WIJ23630.1 hypothetical protein QOV41_11150 [Devosia sp. RR2S18]
MIALLGVIALCAGLAWLIAAGQAVVLMRLTARQGRGWREWLFGWWKFDDIRSSAGPAGVTHVTVYQRAVIAFITFLLLGLVLSGWAVNSTQPGDRASIGTRPLNDWRVLPAQFALNTELPIRREAAMPGATLLES